MEAWAEEGVNLETRVIRDALKTVSEKKREALLEVEENREVGGKRKRTKQKLRVAFISMSVANSTETEVAVVIGSGSNTRVPYTRRAQFRQNYVLLLSTSSTRNRDGRNGNIPFRPVSLRRKRWLRACRGGTLRTLFTGGHELVPRAELTGDLVIGGPNGRYQAGERVYTRSQREGIRRSVRGLSDAVVTRIQEAEKPEAACQGGCGDVQQTRAWQWNK
ncbi:hypothetical protein NLG97_g8530 [Lecanicillium saksenae]|uniref:Uncharacterized protein n=1 Tax=Lecanicillium saksenae TaxID=468837 RepID=A0ACC1QIM6_9HYPO|nr:hypothetical protein NLG97_g8530 [Lecanicillium saksenae]